MALAKAKSSEQALKQASLGGLALPEAGVHLNPKVSVEVGGLCSGSKDAAIS